MSDSPKVLRQQLKQLRALNESGALGDAQYAESRAALERRLAGGAAPAQAADSPEAARARRPGGRLWVALGGAAVLLAAAGYFFTGAPDYLGKAPTGVAAQAPANADGKAPHALDSAEFAALIERLAARMKEQPDDADGWSMLGRSYQAMGREEEALSAFERAVKLTPDDASRLADYADALAVKNGRSLDGEPTKLIERALKSEPDNLKALTLAGTAAFNRGDFAGAVKYWDHAVKVGPPDSPITEQARGAANEARVRGNLPPAAAPTGQALPAATGQALPAAVPGTNSAAAAGAVSGTVSLAPALMAKAAPDDTVFIFARPAEGSRAPIAIVRKQVRDLPFTFRLDDSLAMSPETLLSKAGRVIVGARVTKSGQAMPQPGDLEGLSAATAVGSSGIALVIAKEVK
jgi:cytochrome c-type biogenesis protein CcmH